MINAIKDIKVAIIGLGYVGLPLALEFAKKRKVTGFDLKKKRIEELNSGIDKNFEFNKLQMKLNLMSLKIHLLLITNQKQNQMALLKNLKDKLHQVNQLYQNNLFLKIM